MAKRAGAPTKWLWTLQSPDGEIYRTDNLLAFLASRPEDFPNTKNAYQSIYRVKKISPEKYKGHRYNGWLVINVEPNIVSPRLINLAGKRFGSLTVLYRVIGASPTTWRCRCDCGAEKNVLASNLSNGRATSCGCHVTANVANNGNHQGIFVDLTGLRFGKLQAIFYDSRRHKWVCRCDCGGSCALATTYLTNGSRTDCGCEAAKASAKRAEAGATGNVMGTNVNTIQHIMDGKIRTTNTSGATGVRIFRRQSGLVYGARISVRGKEINLGIYHTMEEAIKARKAAEEKYFGGILEAYRNNAYGDPGTPSPDQSGPLYSLRARRIAAGLTMTDLSRRVGISYPFLNNLEHLRRVGSKACLAALAEALDCTVEDLAAKPDTPTDTVPSTVRPKSYRIAIPSLRAKRISLSLRQVDLAELTGLSVQTIHRSESGHNVDFETCEKICDVLGCTVEDLTDMPEPSSVARGFSRPVPTLFARRFSAGFTQAELAERVGVHPVSISLYEHGRAAGINTCRKLAESLGCTVEDLCRNPDDDNSKEPT